MLGISVGLNSSGRLMNSMGKGSSPISVNDMPVKAPVLAACVPDWPAD